MIIDAHVHLYPEAVNRAPAAWAEEHDEPLWAVHCTRRRKDGTPVQGFPAVADLLRAMDAAGVDRAVLLGWYWQNHRTCVNQNRFYAACVQAHPTRFTAFATLHPAAGPAAREEVRWAKSNGFAGLGELSPHSQGVSLADPLWRQVIQLAGDLKLPVNLHVTDPQSKPFPGRVDTPLADFVALAREFPATKFILAHWGGGLAFDAENRVLKNVYYDTAASPLLYGPEVWRRAPADRVLFGTDFPLVLYPKKGSSADFAALLAEAREAGAAPAVLGDNARTLLGL